jgi:hypothetical protein
VFSLLHLRKTTTNILLTRSLPDVITDPVIETARNRVHVLRETRELWLFIVCVEPTDICGECIPDASLELGLEPVVGAFIQQQLNNFEQQHQQHQQQLQQQIQQQFQQFQQQFQQQLGHHLIRIEATIANIQIMSHNRRMVLPSRPLRKYVRFSAYYPIHLCNSSLNPLDCWRRP